MDSDLNAAMRYLSSPAGSFWKWDDKGEVVVWTDGSTIAFREELAAILGRLEPQGLPQIDAVMLLVAATRGYWSERSRSLMDQLAGRTRARDSEIPSNVATSLFEGLNRIHALPGELKHSLESKCALALIVFEAAPRAVSAEIASIVCRILEKRMDRVLPCLSKLSGGRAQTTKSLLHDLWPLTSGLSGITEESLTLRQQVGLDSEPRPVEVDFPIDQATARSLLERLANDDEFAGLSKLVRNLAAVVELPRAISDSNELPLGGVSDLTNRGTLDRLLLSELAHDDLMLSTRVALNEALYLRRETPPGFPTRHRHVLIDAGLRMWGVPRVFSTAILLSLAATLRNESTLSAYRASGNHIVSINMASRDGLVDHLSKLEHQAHPGESLTSFFRHIQRDDREADVVIVTTDAALNDPDFQRHLGDADIPAIYIATVNRDGGFQLWSRGLNGRKCHLTLRLDIDAILTQPSNAKLVDETIETNLPAILQTSPFPLRMPYPINADFKKEVIWSVPIRHDHESVQTPHRQNADFTAETGVPESLLAAPLKFGVFVLTRDHRLLLFDNPVKGALTFKPDKELPFGKCIGSWSSDLEGRSFAVIHRSADRSIHLLSINSSRRVVQVERLPSQRLSSQDAGALGASAQGDILFLFFRSGIEAFGVTTKTLLNSTDFDLADVNRHLRYFFNAPGHIGTWSVVTYDGTQINFQRVPLKQSEQFVEGMAVLCVFDQPGLDGPFAVLKLGSILNIADGSNLLLVSDDDPSAELRVVDVDPNGSRLLIEFSRPRIDPTQSFIVDTKTGSTNLTRGGHKRSRTFNFQSLAECDAMRVNMGTQPMRHLTSVVLRNEQLTLISKGQNSFQFHATQSALVIATNPNAGNVDRLSRTFTPTKQSRFAESLRVAQWEDGSRIWIDSRGLLHLQSSDPLIPETTLLLDAKGVAVWTSDGRTHGTSYYVDDSSGTISPEEVVSMILIPFVSRLR